MIIESENQYQDALNQIERIIKENNGTPPLKGSVASNKIEELLAEVKIYENKYYKSDTGEEIPTFEFWSAKAGVVQGESQDPNDYEIIKLKENELEQKHIDILAGEFINQFNKLPAAARRLVRFKLKI